MLEQIVNYLSINDIPLWSILFFALFITFLENIFPPSPSDVILVFLGALAGMHGINFFIMLMFSTIGSSAGFALVYWLGFTFGTKIIDSGKLKFLTEESLVKPRLWFKRWGYTIIILNRFLSGTRAVISFFAGISEINPVLTILLASVSSLIWNTILLLLGISLGSNWRLADKYLNLYGNIILPLVIAIIIILIIRWIIKRKKESKANV